MNLKDAISKRAIQIRKEVEAEVEAELATLRAMLDDPDGGERCQRCGRLYRTVYHAPDLLWKRVTGKTGNGLYCPHCFDSMAREQGIELFWGVNEDE
jgi:hypothetical protein